MKLKDLKPREAHPIHLLNTYIPMRYRIYATIWPPRLRMWIGDTVLIIAVWIMGRRGVKANRNGIIANVQFAYDGFGVYSKSLASLCGTMNLFPILCIRLAVKILMIRNQSRASIVRQACQAYNKLEETTHGKET